MRKNQSPFEKNKNNTVVLYENCSCCCCCSSIATSLGFSIFLDAKIRKIKKDKGEKSSFVITSIVLIIFLICFVLINVRPFYALFLVPFIPITIISFLDYYRRQFFWAGNYVFAIIVYFIVSIAVELGVWVYFILPHGF